MDAILIEMERLDPDRLPSVHVVASMMLTAAESANSPFTEPSYDEVQARAMADERRLFAAKVQHWTAQTDFRSDPVPYRRVLAPQESSAWRTSLHGDGGYRTAGGTRC
ncbi:hypothetical protein ACFYPG_05970 [Micromonospora sp. NPDC005553]|uniref:hypothetical protein n=1 Tax=unclassified Micromonospora TaxID=2617518 RepID=UPI00339E1CB9